MLAHTEKHDLYEEITCPILVGKFVLSHTQTLPRYTLLECGEQSILWTYTCKIAVFQILGAVDFFVLPYIYIYIDGLSFNMELVLSWMLNPGTSYVSASNRIIMTATFLFLLVAYHFFFFFFFFFFCLIDARYIIANLAR